MSPQALTIIYYSFLLLLSVIFYGSSKPANGNSKTATAVLLTFVLSYIGFREISRFYADTLTYSMIFQEYEKFPLQTLAEASDYGFGLLTMFLSYFHSERLYFIVIGLLYVLPLYFVFKKNISCNFYTALLIFICSFSFIGYGVNGLRNGLATTFLICAFFNKKIIGQIAWIVLACSMHKSALLPGGIFLLTKYYKNPKFYIYAWFACIAITMVAHNQLENWLGSLTILNDGNDNRLNGYMSGKFDGGETGNVSFSHTGFRYDFLLYSAVPIYLGWKYITKYYYENEFYKRLYCTYTAANAAWILTIYIPFNNRFAYLSWFMYPIVMSLPLLTQDNFIPKQEEKIRLMVLLNCLFTFIMWL